MKNIKLIIAAFFFISSTMIAQAAPADDYDQVGSLDTKLQQALNKQINAELHAAYLYLSMAAYLESKSLVGAASWMHHQAEEEAEHAMKFFDYVNDRGARVILTDIKAPPSEWKSPSEVFQQAFKHEQKVTKMINNLVKLASQKDDAAMHNFLQFFLAEQVEKLASAKLIVDRLNMIGNSSPGLLMIDQRLGERGETEEEGN